jgi:hypothetical protein
VVRLHHFRATVEDDIVWQTLALGHELVLGVFTLPEKS